MKQDKTIEHYQAEFDRLLPVLPGDGALREQAFQRFAEQGFPSVHVEAWKYTDLRPLAKLTPEAEPESTTEKLVDALMPPGWEALRIQTVDGQLQPIKGLPEGVTALPLSEALAQEPGLLKHDDDPTPLRDLNSAFARDGLLLDIAEGVQMNQPIHLQSMHTDVNSAMRNLRFVIRLGEGAECTLVEHYAGTPEARHFVNSITDIALAPKARLSRVLLQEDAQAAWHIHTSRIRQAGGSVSKLTNIDLGSRVSRHDCEVSLDAEGAETHLHGLYFPDGERHIDNHTLIDHRAPGCVSREVYHGLLDGKGRGVFNGRIVVHKDAQKTDSEQSSRAILLSKQAEVDAKPELEIYADDVKCAHGATVGQLDDKALFYLTSRGIDRDTARALLVCSFANEIVATIEDETLRRHVLSLVLSRLPGGLSVDEVLA